MSDVSAPNLPTSTADITSLLGNDATGGPKRFAPPALRKYFWKDTYGTAGDESFILTVDVTPVNVDVTDALTVNRNATLSKTNAYNGARFRITRSGDDAFKLNVLNGSGGPILKAMASGTYAEFIYDGTDWVLEAVGIGNPGGDLSEIERLTGSGYLRRISDAEDWELVDFITHSSVAAAATTDLGSVESQSLTVTGAYDGITSFGSSAPIGAIKFVTFTSAGAVITHGASTIVCPLEEDIITTAGQSLILRHESAGKWRVIDQLFTAPVSRTVTVTSAAELQALLRNNRREYLTILIPDGSNWVLPNSTIINVPCYIRPVTYSGASIGSVTLDCALIFNASGASIVGGIEFIQPTGNRNLLQVQNSDLAIDNCNATWQSGATGSAVYSAGSNVYIRPISRASIWDYSGDTVSGLTFRFLYDGFGWIAGGSYGFEASTGAGSLIQLASSHGFFENVKCTGSGKGNGTTVISLIRNAQLTLWRTWLPGGAYGVFAGSTGVVPVQQSKVHIGGTSLSVSLTDPFTTTNGSAVVSVADVDHERAVGDRIKFSGATAVGGITISGTYFVTAVTDDDNYTITHSAPAGSDAGPGGGSVTALYAGDFRIDNHTNGINFPKSDDVRVDTNQVDFTNNGNDYARLSFPIQGAEDGVQTIATDANFTLTPYLSRKKEILHTGTLAADRTVTLSTTFAREGDYWNITVAGVHTFSLNIGGLKSLTAGQSGRFVFDGTAWYHANPTVLYRRDVFTSDGTWKKRPWATRVRATCIGPGGGAGGGARTASGSASSGGGGGGAGMRASAWYDAADLNSTEACAVPAGGLGGAGATSDGNAGSNGAAPLANTIFGSNRIIGYAGGAGAGGQLAGNSGGGGGAGGFGVGGNGSGATAGAAGSIGGIIGGTGAGAANNLQAIGEGGGGGGAAGGGLNGGIGQAGGISIAGPGGGGSGGGVSTAPAAFAGGAGGRCFGSYTAPAGGSGAVGTPGGTAGNRSGAGGAGGGSNVAGDGYAGGAGGRAGGGGGGGGSAVGGNGGAGGNGGDGEIIVESWG